MMMGVVMLVVLLKVLKRVLDKFEIFLGEVLDMIV